MHHLPDFWKALALSRLAGMLRPGGVLLLHDLTYSFHPDQAEDVFGRWFAGASDDPSSGYTAEDYAEHIRTEYSTFTCLLEPMIIAHGLEPGAALELPNRSTTRTILPVAEVQLMVAQCRHRR